ncbi:hypothetical protein FQN52_000596 [Onygenales sp. PD_12]|nr:hypothetical protein FQN52_000596 [Onygenales sp. PD_12]KAK2784156.1 hypothetical protein FQN53_008765 [Emmonsiellopsis sp. PD_33]KAK2805716.1 hypothetical protein FQN51_009219 [Onygenales sp. PD_10]
MFYFMYHLRHDNFKIPFTFFVFIATSLLTILYLLITSLVQIFTSIPPTVSLVCNSILLVLWTVSLALLSWNLSHTITFTCNAKYWGTSTGISVCHLYKALFSFTLLSVVTHSISVYLDARDRSKNRWRITDVKRYQMMGDEFITDDMDLENERDRVRYAHPFADTPSYAHTSAATDTTTYLNTSPYCSSPTRPARPISPASSCYSRATNAMHPGPLFGLDRGPSTRSNNIALEPYRPKRPADEDTFAYEGGLQAVDEEGAGRMYGGDDRPMRRAGTLRDDHPLYYTPWGMGGTRGRGEEGGFI